MHQVRLETLQITPRGSHGRQEAQRFSGQLPQQRIPIPDQFRLTEIADVCRDVSLNPGSAKAFHDWAGGKAEYNRLVATTIQLLQQKKQAQRRPAQRAAVMDVENALHGFSA
jgi:hypothetical protein